MRNIFFFFIFPNDFSGLLNKAILSMVAVHLFAPHEVDYMSVNFRKVLFLAVLMTIRYPALLSYTAIFTSFQMFTNELLEI